MQDCKTTCIEIEELHTNRTIFIKEKKLKISRAGAHDQLSALLAVGCTQFQSG